MNFEVLTLSFSAQLLLPDRNMFIFYANIRPTKGPKLIYKGI